MTFADTVRKVLEEVDFRQWAFVVGDMGTGAYISVAFYPLSFEGHPGELQRGRKWYVSSHSTKSELLQTALKAVLTAMEHEIREEFTYKGVAIFGPHFDVDALLELAHQKNHDIREEVNIGS